MKILLSRKESSTNDVTHTSLCHSTHIVFFRLFNSNTTCCCLETKKKILFHYIVLVCWTTVCTAAASTTIETCSSHGIYTQRVRSQLMSHYYCENLKVVVFCFCRLHNYNNKSNTNFFLSLSKWRSHIAQVVRTTTTRKKKHLQVIFFRDVAQIIFEFTLVVAGTSTTATTALEALITSKKLETQFSQGSLINDVTQWHISLRQQQQLEVVIFFTQIWSSDHISDTILIIWTITKQKK